MTEDVSYPHPVERSLYHYILDVLEDLHFEGVIELKRESSYIDILFESGKHRFILEVKIERKTDGKEISNPLVDGIVQAYHYGLENNTKNLIVICYPSFVAEEILTLNEPREKALETKVEAAILTQYWWVHERKRNIVEILSILKQKIEQNIQAQISVNSTSAIIRKCVVTLARLINKYYKDEKSLKEAMNHLTRDFALFEKLSQHRRTSLSRNETIDLMAFILVNQILFYFLYSKKSQEMTQSERVDEIKKLTYLTDLDFYFNQIRKIDYKPIFEIFVVQRIPSTTEIVKEVNKIIECLLPLQISEMKQDLYGRLIGNSLPSETRKILASFYTRSQSAELLVNLTIKNWTDTVWDLACGSGTLLLSSYDRKMKLYRELKRSFEPGDEDKLHLKFIEKEITGTDIMPFACYLTGLNLSAKNLKRHTDSTRISTMNSLSIESLDEPKSIDEAYGDISAELAKVTLSQKTLDNYSLGSSKIIPPTNQRKFVVEKVSCVVINPPFTNINKLPSNYRSSFTSSASSEVCGKRIALWGHFMALADRVLKNGGCVGAVIPISLLHGNDTCKIRKFFLENYSIEFIIKPLPNTSFSEDSEFMDIIFIAEKTKPSQNHKVKIVALKTDIREKSTPEIDHLTKRISSQLEEEKDEPDYWQYEISQRELLENIDNLMPFVFTNDATVKKEFTIFLSKLKDNKNLTKIQSTKIHDGNQLRPQGTANRSMFTRYDESNIVRIKHSNFIFKKDDPKSPSLVYYDKTDKAEKIIEKAKLSRTFRTLAGVNTIDVSGLFDYVLTEKLTVKESSHILIPNRFRANTLETYLTAFYTEEPLTPYNSFTMYFCSKDEAKLQVLYFNSIFYLVQFLVLVKQSTRGFLEIRHVDLQKILVPDREKNGATGLAEIGKVFDEIRSLQLHSLLDQLRDKPEYRLKIDVAISKYLGISMSEKDLKHLYDKVYHQIENNLK